MDTLGMDLSATERDLARFIELQKEKIVLERQNLNEKKQKSPRPTSSPNPQTLTTTATTTTNQPAANRRYDSEKRNSDFEGMSVLNLSGNEERQRQLQRERQEEYKRHLAEKEKRTGRRFTQGGESHRAHQDIDYSPSSKPQTHNDHNHNDINGYQTQSVAENKVGASKSEFSFDSEEEKVLFRMFREQFKKQNTFHEPKKQDMEDFKRAVVFEGRSSSVPPNIPSAPPKIPSPNIPLVFGGRESMSARKQRDLEARRELEKQIEEKDNQKLRDKLKRLGRITSDTDVSAAVLSDLLKGKPAPPRRSITNEMKDNAIQTSRQNSRQGRDIGQNKDSGFNAGMSNPYMMPNQMMNNQMIPSWANFGFPPNMMPMTPAMYPPMMMGYPQMPANGMANMNNGPPPQDTNRQPRSSRRRRTKSAEKANEDEVEDVKYEPSSSNAPKRPALQPPGGHSEGVFNQLMNKNSDRDVKKAQKLTYQEELKNQMEENRKAKEREKQEIEKYNRKIEKQIEEYDPWGRKGAGAPMTNKDGKVVADRKQLLQEAASAQDGQQTNRQQGQDSSAVQTGPSINKLELKLNLSNEEESPMLRALAETANINLNSSLNSSMNTTRSEKTYARGAALKELIGQSPRNKDGQDEYKSFLQQQIDEKKRKQEEEKERQRIEEEKENKRIEEQRLRIQKEAEEEQEKVRRKQEEVRRKNEEMRLIAEEKVKEEQRKQRELREEHDRAIQKEAQARLAQNLNPSSEGQAQSQHRSSSPPLPAIMKQRRLSAAREQQSIENTETNNETNADAPTKRPQSWRKTPVQASVQDVDYLTSIRNTVAGSSTNRESVEDQRDLIKQLDFMRKHLADKERQVRFNLEKDQALYNQMSSAPSKSVGQSDVFEKVKKRSSQGKRLAVNPALLDEFTKHSGQTTANIDPKSFDEQQREVIRQQDQKIRALRATIEQKSKVLRKPESFDIEAKLSQNSLLDSDTKFLSMKDGEEVQVKSQPKKHYRHSQKPKSLLEDQDEDSFKGLLNKPATAEKSESMTSLNIETLAEKNAQRLKQLKLNKEPDVVEDEREDYDLIDEFMSRHRPLTGEHGRPLTGEHGKDSNHSLPSQSYYQVR